MHVSDEAFERINTILTDSDNDIPKTAGVRVFVTGGGCSGLQYGFEISAMAEDDDTIIEKNGGRLFVDPMSHAYLNEATINYVSGLDGESFVIDNPAVTKTCGCGSSFEM